MIGIIVRIDDAAMAANVGGSVKTEFKTFHVNSPQLEEILRKHDGKNYSHAYVVGAELPPEMGF